MTKSVLLIEDHPLYRDALTVVMANIFGAENVCAVSTVDAGLDSVERMPYLSLLLLDLGLPDIQGAEAVKVFRQKYPTLPIIVISASDDRRDIQSALRVGATAFISKAVSTEVISDAIATILARKPLESQWIVPAHQQDMYQTNELQLTPRQQETLRLLCQGFSNKEISIRMNLAEITVKLHVSSIFKTLKVINRTQAVLAARRFGLIPESLDESSSTS